MSDTDAICKCGHRRGEHHFDGVHECLHYDDPYWKVRQGNSKQCDCSAFNEAVPPEDDWTVGDVIYAEPCGLIILDDGLQTFNRVRAREFLSKGGQKDG